jgi:uncharacterized membrane protein YGL010W
MQSNQLESIEYSVAERLLIVPRSHTDVFATRFQVEMYELFHRTPGGRIGHMLGTPLILLGVMMLLAHATGVIWPSVVLAAGIGVYGMRVDRRVGAVTAFLAVGLAFAALLIAQNTGAQTYWVGAALVVGACFGQTLSHAFEDVPPPHSGTTDFVPVTQWARVSRIKDFARSGALVVGVFFWLEFWATFRIWPLQVLHVMMALGYRPELRAELTQRCEEIVAAPAGSDWRSPADTAATL